MTASLKWSQILKGDHDCHSPLLLPPPPFDSVCVVGLGYIGLPTAALIASSRIRVLGVDTNQDHVDQINRGEAPFYEPDFATMLAGVVHQGMLTAQPTTPAADAYIVAVPTPFTDRLGPRSRQVIYLRCRGGHRPRAARRRVNSARVDLPSRNDREARGLHFRAPTGSPPHGRSSQ